MTRLPKHDRLGWFLPLRLASYIVVSLVVVLWLGNPSYLSPIFILYSVFTLSFTVLISLEKKLRLDTALQVVVGLQFVLEILLESGIVYATGNTHSSFTALFLLTIVSASLVYRLVGTLIIASVVSIALSFIIWLGLSIPVEPSFNLESLTSILAAKEITFYAVFLHILIFYLVAFISGYLAEKLRAQRRELADASIALRRARLETDDILKHLNSGLLTIDSAGYIIYFNRASERILGYREEEVRGMLAREVFADRMPQLAERLLNCLSGTTGQTRTEIDIIGADQRRAPLGLSTSLLTEEGSGPRGVIAIFSDLTEAKALEEKVREADRLSAVGELSASIAHEIRNPLAAISGSVEVLRNELDLNGSNSRLLELIIKESSRLNNILSEFLTYARIGRPAYNKVELCHIISDVVEMLRHHKQLHAETRISLNTYDSCVYVVGDEDLLRQMLVNLAYNACEAFEGQPGEIVFRVVGRPTEGVVELSVEDNGPGIPEENIDKVYQPFFSTKRQGTGLGLAIVYRVSQLLRFNLSVGPRLGGGTIFIMRLQSYSPEKVPAGLVSES